MTGAGRCRCINRENGDGGYSGSLCSLFEPEGDSSLRPCVLLPSSLAGDALLHSLLAKVGASPASLLPRTEEPREVAEFVSGR